jgi:nitrogenase-associated protein
MLEAAGHTLERRNLLTAHWTPERLLAFLAPLPVADWFNRAAPRVKRGEVRPDALDADTALALLLEDPLLIRRPLMERTDKHSRHAGFDTAAVDAWVGLGGRPASARSLDGCTAPARSCAVPR